MQHRRVPHTIIRTPPHHQIRFRINLPPPPNQRIQRPIKRHVHVQIEIRYVLDAVVLVGRMVGITRAHPRAGHLHAERQVMLLLDDLARHVGDAVVVQVGVKQARVAQVVGQGIIVAFGAAAAEVDPPLGVHKRSPTPLILV